MFKQTAIAAVLAITAFATGCANPGLPTSYNVIISSDFSDADVASIEQGMQSWTALDSSAPTFSFMVGQTGDDSKVDWSTIQVKKGDLVSVAGMCGEAVVDHVAGCTMIRGHLSKDEGTDTNNPMLSTTGPTMYLTDGSTLSGFNVSYVSVIAHETGHAMGLHHTGAGTIMNPIVDDGTTVPTCTDLAQYVSERPGLSIVKCVADQ